MCDKKLRKLVDKVGYTIHGMYCYCAQCDNSMLMEHENPVELEEIYCPTCHTPINVSSELNKYK